MEHFPITYERCCACSCKHKVLDQLIKSDEVHRAIIDERGSLAETMACNVCQSLSEKNIESPSTDKHISDVIITSTRNINTNIQPVVCRHPTPLITMVANTSLVHTENGTNKDSINIDFQANAFYGCHHHGNQTKQPQCAMLGNYCSYKSAQCQFDDDHHSCCQSVTTTALADDLLSSRQQQQQLDSSNSCLSDQRDSSSGRTKNTRSSNPSTTNTTTQISTPSSSSPKSSMLSSSFPSRWLDLGLGMWFRLVLTYTVMVASLYPVNARPSSDASDAAMMYKNLQSRTVKYLAKFGYLEGPKSETQDLTSMSQLTDAIKALQRAGGIPETGVADSRTSELLKRPRCGNKDEYLNNNNYKDQRKYHRYRFRSTDRPTGSSGGGDRGGNGDEYYSGGSRPYRYRRRASLNRQKRYTTASSSWKHTNLTFRFINYTPDLPESKTRQIISNALRVWSDATPLSFTEVRQSQADIMIQFASKYHSDGYPFDGQGMVLAHAFFPGQGKGGDTHFDDDENWALNHTDGVDLLVVAAHEFGHALGLAHSGDPEALMYPWYMGFEGHFKLPRDDLMGITSLYGSKDKNQDIPKTPSPKDGVVMIPKPNVPPRRTPRPDYGVNKPKVVDDVGPPDPCKSRIDALTLFRKELIIFIGKWFWRLDSRNMFEKPVAIHSFWYGLPEDLQKIDAAYERKDKKMVVFSGDRYWVFSANHLQSGFPHEGRPITEFNIPADVKKIDAAFVWGYNQRTYLVSGDMYWKMDEDNRFVEYDYPRDMGTWKGVPVPLDAAFTDRNDKTYFFKGHHYSEFYDLRMKVQSGYPKQFSRPIFNCPTDKANQINGGNLEVDGDLGSPLVEAEIDGSSSRLRQDDKAMSQENSLVTKENKEGLAPLSVSSSVPLLVTTILMCILVNRFATMEI